MTTSAVVTDGALAPFQVIRATSITRILDALAAGEKYKKAKKHSKSFEIIFLLQKEEMTLTP